MDITDALHADGRGNLIAVRVNCMNDPDVPSFNNFGGINGDVRLHVTDKLYITDAVHADKVAGGGVFVTFPRVSEAAADVQVQTHVLNEHESSRNCSLETTLVTAIR